jgi:hypothetical protein
MDGVFACGQTRGATFGFPVIREQLLGKQADISDWQIIGNDPGLCEQPSLCGKWSATHARVDGIEDVQAIDIRNPTNGDRIAEI